MNYKHNQMTKQPILNLTNFSMNVINEINKLRTNPLEYAKKLVTSASFVGEDELYYNDVTIKLTEKKLSFIEAIEFLEKQEKRQKLTIKSGIIKCCEELMKVLILHDGIENTEEFNTNCHFEKRMNKYGCAFGELDEMIDFGSISPETIVLNFLLCDGDPERRERNILFKEKLNFIGVSSEILPCEKYCTVINLAEHYYDVGEDIPDNLLRIYYPQLFRKLELEKMEKMKKSNELEEKTLKGHHSTNSQPNLNIKNFSSNSNPQVLINTVKSERNNFSKVSTPMHDYNKQLNNRYNTPNQNSERKQGVIKITKVNNKHKEDEDEHNYNNYQQKEYIEKEELENKNVYTRKIVKENKSKTNNKLELQENIESGKPLSNMNDNISKENVCLSDEAEEVLDDNILKISILEKEVIDERTKVKRNLVKKIIIYKDGTTQSIVYQKNR